MDALKIHPNGRVVASYDRSKRAKVWDLRQREQFIDRTGFAPPWDIQVREIEATGGRANFGVPGPSPLGLSSITKTSKPVRARGSGGMTSFARQRVKDAGHILETMAPRGTLCMWTVTVPPGLERETIKRWSRITHNIRNQLTRDLRSVGLPGEVLFVSEWQEKREERYHERVLHLHFLFQGAFRPDCWEYGIKHYSERWEECIKSALGSAYGGQSFIAASRIEKVRKSVGGYLGKYMSKGSNAPDGIPDSGEGQDHPSSWHGISRLLLGRVNAGIRRVTGPISTRIISYLLANSHEFCRFNRWVSFEGADGQPVWIAWYADLKDPFLLSGLFV